MQLQIISPKTEMYIKSIFGCLKRCYNSAKNTFLLSIFAKKVMHKTRIYLCQWGRKNFELRIEYIIKRSNLIQFIFLNPFTDLSFVLSINFHFNIFNLMSWFI